MLQPKKDNFKLNQADQSLLEKEMIAYAEEGATDDDLIEFKNTYIAEKKKTTPKSDSTIPSKNSESVQKVGSLDGVGSNGFPAIDKNLGVPGLKPDLKTVDQLANPPKSNATLQAEQNNALKYQKFKEFSTLPDEIKKENAQKVEDEANGVGFLNNVVSLGKNAYNTALEGMSNTPMMAGLKQLKVNTEPLAEEKKEAKDLMLKQGIKPKDINSNTVLELAKKIKLQKLNDSDIESRKKDFLSDTEIDFEDLKKGANSELSKISNKDKELLKQKAILEPALKDSDDRLNQLNQQLANFKKNNQQPTPEFVDEYNYAIKYHNDILKDVQKTDNQFADNRDKIGDLKTNLDLFKRQYGKVNNFVSNIGATALDLAAGGFGIVDYGFNAAYGALGIDTGPKENSEIVTGLRGASKNIRDRIAKPINIDNIEDAGDFGDWMANTVIANQVPIYGLIATGTGGIVALGGSSLGTKYGDMVQEMNPDNPVEGQILKYYSDVELAWKPVGFGIAETASALVDAHIMKGAARVLASATQPERRLISQTIAKRLLNVGKETIKGGATEAVDEMATQGVENIIDGKPFTEGMKDAGGAGGAMGALIPFFAGNIAVATKSFSIDNKIQNSAKKTLALEKELANPNLSEDAKKIIKTNFEESKKTTENLLKKQVKDISKMSNENFQEILRIENEQAKLKEKAIEIKTQETLPNDIKKQLLSDFSVKFNELETDRVDILSGKKTMPIIEKENEKPQEVSVTETQPQAEVPQQAEAEKVEIKNEGKAEVPTEKNVQERLNINNPFYKKVNDVLVKLGLIEKYNPETGTGDIIGGVAQPLSGKGGFAVGDMYFYPDGSISYVSARGTVQFDKNGNVISENTKEVAQEKNKIEIEGTKESITNLEKTRDSEAFKYKEVTETDVLGNKKKVKRLKTPQELKESTDKINAAINKAKSALSELEKNQPQEVSPVEDVVATSVEKPSDEKQLEDIKNGDVVTFTYENKSEIPEIFKDKISSEGEINGKKEIKVTIAKSLAEYHLQNEKSPTTNNPINGNLSTRTSDVGESGIIEQQSPAKESVPSAFDGGESKGVIEVETKKIKGKKLTFYKIDGYDIDSGFAVEKNKDGYIIQSALIPFAKQRQGIGTDFYIRMNNESIEKTGKPLKSSDNLSNSNGKPFWEKLVDKGLAEKTEDGFKFKEQTKVTNETAPSQDSTIDGNVRLGASNVGESGITKQQSSPKESVPSAVDVGKSEIANEVDYALNQIDKGILQWNGDINSPRIDLGISWADIRKGEADLKRGKVDSAPAKRLIEAIGKSKKDGGYRYKLGTGGANMRSAEFVTFEDLQRANNEIPLTDAELEQINREQEQLAKEYENYFNSLNEKEQTEIRENYENRPTVEQGVSTKTTEIGEGKNDVSNEKTPSRKESRKKIAEAKVDDIVNAINGIDSIFGIKIKVDDVDGLNKNGIDIVNVIASIVKQAVNAGIDVDEAIKKTIEHFKKTIDFEVNIDDVKEKLGVEKPQDFESKAGKKSVLNRMASGNSSAIKKAIAKYSLDYEIENQKEAKLKAEMFVDEVGVDDALIAVRKGLIDGAQGAFIYARAIEILEQEINSLKGDDKLDAIADYQELLGQISDELDNRSRSNGRFIAALAEIYNSSGGRYNLTKMVNDYKAQNNGTISKEVLEKLKNVEQKLKESEAKLAELEAKKRIEEENEAFNNILESVARRKRINTNAKISDKQKAKAFADKLRSFKISNLGGTNVATPFSLAYDLAIETAAKAFELKGFVSDAIKAGVNSIRNSKLSKDEKEQALSDLFDLFDDSDVNTGQKGMMSISEEGVLRIPHSLIREKVENGIDNIDDLVSELMTDAQELFPDLDFTERQVRDIVTGYGKISNPTSDEIETQISIMKSLGKIASGLEDVNKGQRPLRSGQQRREPTMQERVGMKKLKALLRDLPLAEADIKKAYKTALEAIKKRLSNEIEELDNQIANGEKRKGEKTVIEYDQEAKDLKAERDAKKAILDEMVGKPELTEQQKIDRAEKILQKRLDDLQQKIDANEIDYAKKPETVTSAKLEEMRKLKKEYEAQIQKMREDAGLAEERLIEIAKRNASKRLAALKERIANKDFEPRKRKPTPTDVELNKIKSEIAAQKEIFDKEVYKLELQNRRWEQKGFDYLKDALSVPKILSFTGDLSFVGIQNVTQVYKMGANSLINLAKTGKLKGTFRDAMAKTFKAMASPDFEQKYMQAVKANPNYQLWKDSKLGIVESHYKESAKAEVFQHNAITTLFDILGNYVASKGYEKAGNIIKNYVNIISIFERGQTVFENQMRINRFQEGADLLKAQGFNPVDDIQEYRKVAAAVNTLTGRANTGSKAAAALREANGTIFSSFSNWAAGVNQLNPYWYYTLTPTARKMALTDVAHHIVGAGSLLAMAALYALGQDDDDEDKIVVGTTPTSSDFALIKVGNLRIDPWAGKKTTVVAFSRLVNGGKTDKYGNFKKYGIEYEDEDWIDLPLEYAGNKIAPGPRFALDRFFKTKEVEYQGNKFREDKYGVDFKESKYLIPLIFENFREVNEEQPNLFGKATMSLSWTGLINTNVYGGMKEGFKDMPDDLIEKEYKVKIQKIKDNEKILDSAIEKMTKDYVEKKISKNEIMRKVGSLVNGDAELFNKSIESIVAKVNKEELKTLVDDPFYLGLKKENNPEIQAILFYSKFKDDSEMSDKEKKERDRNLRYIEFDAENQKFKDALQELKNSKNKPVN